MTKKADLELELLLLEEEVIELRREYDAARDTVQGIRILLAEKQETLAKVQEARSIIRDFMGESHLRPLPTEATEPAPGG